jgi:DNA invertase Pin-like site-specific DNA recombinase
MATQKTTKPLRAIGYTRVSTGEQGDSGLGLEAQRQAITTACDQRGWKLLTIEEDVESGKCVKRRSGLNGARGRLCSGEADVLVASKLDRLSGSVLDFGALLEEATNHGYAVKVLDPDVDLSTPNGRLVARVICSVAEWEREMISTRTREALAVKKAQGIKLGRPPSIPHDVAERISRQRRAGSSLEAIADGLNVDKVPTPRGGLRWRASSIQRIAARLESVA